MDQTAGPAAPRLVPALGLALLAPVCAELLSGYDDTTGHPVVLVFMVLVGAALYGAPALLIRETARRTGLGWPGVLLLAAALGIVQAGIIDQSLFSTDYRGIDYWAAMTEPTRIDALGISAITMLTFVGGHMAWSFTAPIAIVEAIHTRGPQRPWLRAPGLAVTAIVYLAAAYFVLRDHYANETDHASPAQLTGAAACAAALIALAFLLRRNPVRRPRRVPPAWALVPASAAAIIASTVSYSWTGFALAAVLLGGGAVAIVFWSRSMAWTPRHAVALASGALYAVVLPSFITDPIGEVDPVAKYANNAVMTLLVIGLTWWAMRRSSPAAPPR
ncbi:hypothetical protein [Glycomyces artemisiae]|uniref:Uncharacterized protein n=1 Tax=Glycomyces artemisiae TaxID=1076443 RepID=A0A2T0UAU2_9ACTN|nr:hypothetical protein [Glycomyces artemisiae]PRY55024.1 hypothetical protein B0I28_113134 [Glycomyces artemisiae]